MNIVFTIQQFPFFTAIQFAVNEFVMCEKIIFDKSENVNKDNYQIFHYEDLCEATIFVKQNEIINIFNYGMNMRRLIKC